MPTNDIYSSTPYSTRAAETGPKELSWDDAGDRIYETGVKKGVLYNRDDSGNYPSGEAWTGLTSVTDSPSGADETALYADDIKYVGLRAAEEYGGTIECYHYPDGWEKCNGTYSGIPGVSLGQQARSSFGISYVTTLGNDIKLNDFGYKLHLVYGATASPSESSYETINDSPDAITFSYEFSTVPEKVSVKIDGKTPKPTANIVLNSVKCEKAEKIANLHYLEAILYGQSLDGFTATGLTPTPGPRLPKPDEVIQIMQATITTSTTTE